MPPGTTTNASDDEDEMVQAREEGAVLEGRLTNGLTSCSKGSSTRMPTEPSAAVGAACAPSLAACIRPGPPPVTMAQPRRRASSAAMSRTARRRPSDTRLDARRAEDGDAKLSRRVGRRRVRLFTTSHKPRTEADTSSMVCR